MPSTFQTSAGIHDSTSFEQVEESVDRYWGTFLDMPLDESFLLSGQSSSDAAFFMAPNNYLSGSSRVLPPLMNSFCEWGQSWYADPLAFDSGSSGDRMSL
jgi:hypothetical protein